MPLIFFFAERSFILLMVFDRIAFKFLPQRENEIKEFRREIKKTADRAEAAVGVLLLILYKLYLLFTTSTHLPLVDAEIVLSYMARQSVAARKYLPGYDALSCT